MPAYGAAVCGLDSFAPRQTDFYFAGEPGFHFAHQPSFNFVSAMEVGGFATPTNIDGFATPPVDFNAFNQLARPAPAIATLSRLVLSASRAPTILARRTASSSPASSSRILMGGR